MKCRTHYSSDLTDRQWQLIRQLLPPVSKKGRRPIDRRWVISAILYVIRTGCQWRMLPSDFPNWNTVYNNFWRWRNDGTWQRIHDKLREKVRKASGKKSTPTVAIIDSQSIRTAEGGETRGYDAGKKITGRKRHIAVDTLGMILAVVVHGADCQDQYGAKWVIEKLAKQFCRIKVIFGDSAYKRSGLPEWVNDTFGWILQAVLRPVGVKGFAGSNKSVVQRSAQLAQSREKAKETGARQLWAGASETQFGVPVELTNDASGFDDSVARKHDAYRANPGRFHVAIGLALQGIGKAAINTNLIPKSGGIKEKLGRFWKAKKTQAEVAWGIDYDDVEVRLIGLELGEDGAVKVSECRSVQIGSAPKSKAPNSEVSSSELVDAIQAISDDLPLADKRICIGIPGVSVLARFMEVPKSSKDKVESAIRFESKHHIPFSLDETVWDYHLLNEIDEDDEEQISLPVALVAVKEPLVVERLAPFEEVGLQVSSVQSCVTALYNWAFHHINSRPDEDDGGDSVVALLDVRYDNSSFIVVGKDIFWSRSWFRGIKECRSAVASALAVNADTAETALREPHRLPSLSQLAIALEPFYENTNREIAMSISKVKASHPYELIDRIAITGLGSEVHGLIPFLRRGHLPFRKQFNGE